MVSNPMLVHSVCKPSLAAIAFAKSTSNPSIAPVTLLSCSKGGQLGSVPIVIFPEAWMLSQTVSVVGAGVGDTSGEADAEGDAEGDGEG